MSCNRKGLAANGRTINALGTSSGHTRRKTPPFMPPTLLLSARGPAPHCALLYATLTAASGDSLRVWGSHRLAAGLPRHHRLSMLSSVCGACPCLLWSQSLRAPVASCQLIAGATSVCASSVCKSGLTPPPAHSSCKPAKHSALRFSIMPSLRRMHALISCTSMGSEPPT